MKRKSLAFVFAAVTTLVVVALPSESLPAADMDGVFATVGTHEISREEFEQQVYQEARQTYYHGKAPGAEEFIEFRRRVADRMIDRQLLLAEARRRNIRADQEAIDSRLASYESRYGQTERWKTEGAEMVAALRAKFEEDGLVSALEADVRQVPVPDRSEVRAFYDGNPDLFTEPARNRVSLILLGVPPSASSQVWAAAREEAQRILGQLGDGASFEELAGLHSSDPSAPRGGDMGYLHSGMLGENAEAAINELELGGVSGPVQVLEGIAIFKLTERKPAALRSFDEVHDRAAELARRHQGDMAWDSLIARLRSEAKISVDDEYLVRVPAYAQ
jgi:parvulin-like peptidyl-prolyl isomerase